MKVGLLGLGRIGRAVATNLLADGFAVAAVDRPGSRDFALTGGFAPSAAALAAGNDVIVSCLATEEQMTDAFLGGGGLVEGTHAGMIVIEMGTFPISMKRRLADILATRGAAMLDCPISGTPPVVARREAMLFVSGDPGTIERCSPVLNGISARHVNVGAFGCGMATKLVTNFLVILNTMALAEAFVLGRGSGLEPELMIEAIGNSFAGSRVFDFRAPILAARRYQPAPGPARIVWKDLNYIREHSAALGLAGPLLETALEWYGRMIDAGRGEDECAGVFEILAAATKPT